MPGPGICPEHRRPGDYVPLGHSVEEIFRLLRRAILRQSIQHCRHGEEGFVGQGFEHSTGLVKMPGPGICREHENPREGVLGAVGNRREDPRRVANAADAAIHLEQQIREFLMRRMDSSLVIAAGSIETSDPGNGIFSLHLTRAARKLSPRTELSSLP